MKVVASCAPCNILPLIAGNRWCIMDGCNGPGPALDRESSGLQFPDGMREARDYSYSLLPKLEVMKLSSLRQVACA